MNEKRKLKVLVCGSRFGQFYLEALKMLENEFEIVGMLARGSERSKKCSDYYGIRLFTDVEEITKDIDIACVVVRTGVMGGIGTDLTIKLLEKGINVITEQPIHSKDIALCLKTAKKNKVNFMVGDLYANLPSVKEFRSCTKTLANKNQKLLYLNVDCATQVSFPLIHILSKLFATIRPWKTTNVLKGVGPFQVYAANIGEVPVLIKAHNEADEKDSDNYLHLFHKITAGFEGGSLTLTDSHGPVIWNPRLHIPKNDLVPSAFLKDAPEYLLDNSTEILSDRKYENYRDILTKVWPRAISEDLLYLKDVIKGNIKNSEIIKRSQQELICSEKWHELMNSLGYPMICKNNYHKYVSVNVLKQSLLTEDYFLDNISKAKIDIAMYELNKASHFAMLNIMQKQGVLNKKDVNYSEGYILRNLDLKKDHYHVIRRWLKMLTENNYLVKELDGYLLNSNVISDEELQYSWECAKEKWNRYLGSSLAMEYFIKNVQNLSSLMNNEKKAAFILFPEGKMDIANALYSDTTIARFLNKSVSDEIIKRLRGRDVTLRVLEIGAGTGSTTKKIIKELNKISNKNNNIEYLFTDISQFFLSNAKEEYKKYPWMKFKKIDLDDNLVAQGLKKESVDIIVAAGVLNNVNDIDKVIGELKDLLRHNGEMLITEATGEAATMLVSQAFMMDEAADDRKNTESTFMTLEQWIDVFKNSNLNDIYITPDKGHPLDSLGQKLFIVRKN